MSATSNHISEKEQELIIARLEVLSPELHFSSGNSNENISRDEMIEHVMNGDEVGNEYVKTELEFLRAIKTGELYERLVVT